MIQIDMNQAEAQSLQRFLSSMSQSSREIRSELRREAGELWVVCDKGDERTRHEFKEMNLIRDDERTLLRHEKQIDTLIRGLKGAR